MIPKIPRQLGALQRGNVHSGSTLRSAASHAFEHTFGTLKAWMGAAHFQTRTLNRVSTEMSLHVLAYNLKRVMKILGTESLMQAMRAQCPFNAAECVARLCL